MTWTFTRFGPSQKADDRYRDCEHTTMSNPDGTEWSLCAEWDEDEEERHPVPCEAPWRPQTHHKLFHLEAAAPDGTVQTMSVQSGSPVPEKDVWAALEAVFTKRLNEKYGAPPA